MYENEMVLCTLDSPIVTKANFGKTNFAYLKLIDIIGRSY